MALDDMALVSEFAAHRSETAFATLVERHLTMVYSAAWRQVGDVHLAQDVAQAVFIVLARKAASLGPRTILSAWLYRTTCYASADALKSQRRRRLREQEAFMQANLSEAPDRNIWECIAPLLDEAMAGLAERDRAVLVMRFFENRTMEEMAAALRVQEATVRKRVTRPVDRLRKIFSKRSVVLGATPLAAVLLTQSASAAPAGLANMISTSTAQAAPLSASLSALVEGTLKNMTWLKVKVGATVVATVAVGGLVAVGVLSRPQEPPPSHEAATLLERIGERYRDMKSYSDTGRTFNGFVTNSFSLKLARRDPGRDDYYRVEWHALNIVPRSVDGVAWSDGQGHFQSFWNPDPRIAGDAVPGDKNLTKATDTHANINTVANMSGGAAWTIPPLFFGPGYDPGFGLLGQADGFRVTREEDVGGVACVVLEGHLKHVPDLPVRLWVGKEDLLIRQAQRTTFESVPALRADPPELKPLLETITKASTAEEREAIMAKIQAIAAAQERETRRTMTHTEIHENIVVNPPLTARDFDRADPP